MIATNCSLHRLQVPQDISCRLYTFQVSQAMPSKNLCQCVSMNLLSRTLIQTATVTSNESTIMFLKAGPCDVTTDDLCSEVVRYYQVIDKPFLRKKNEN